MAEKRVSVRFSAEGDADVRAAMRGIGESGEAEMRRIEQSVEAASRRLDSIGRQMQIVGGAISVAGAAALGAIRSQLNAADEMGKAAQRLGLPVEALSQLRYAAELSGVSVGSLDTAIQRLSQRMVSGADRFAELGVEVRNADGTMRDTVDVLADLADVLAEMPDGAEKTALMIDMMGRSAADLIPMLNQGGAALRAAAAEADRLGITITEAMSNSAARTNDAMTRMQAALRGLATQITAEMAPMIADLAESLSGLVQRFAQLEPETQRVIAAITGITIVAGPALVALGSLLRALASLRIAMVALVAFSGPLGVALALLTAAGAAAVLWAANMGEAEDPLASVRAAQEELNAALGIFSQTAAPQAGREAIAYARNLKQAALAALEFAQAQLLAAQARQQERMEAAGRFVPGGWEPDPRVTNPEVEHWQSQIDELSRTIDGARRTIQGLSIQLHTAGDAAAETAPILGRLTLDTDEFERAVRRAGGSTRQMAEVEIPDLSLALDDLGSAFNQLEQSFERAFVNFVTGAQSAREAISSLLRDLARLLAQQAFQGLFGGMFGGGGLFGGLRSFEGGGFTWPGPRIGGLDGRGGQLALLHPNETVIDHERGQSAAAPNVTINVDARGSVEGEAERFARYFNRHGREVIEVAVARTADRRKRGHGV